MATRAIRSEMEKVPLGVPFTLRPFLTLGSRPAIDQAFSRLVKAGAIERITRGVFVRPKVNPHVGKVSPAPIEVARALADGSGEIVAIHGAEAARRFGLTTQMPTQPVFSTSGPSRRFRIGKLNVVMRHVSPRRLELAGRPAGEALSALCYLGKEAVTPATIERIGKALPPAEFELLKSSASLMPGWLAAAIRRSEQGLRDD